MMSLLQVPLGGVTGRARSVSCQVTILAMSVFEKMCAITDPQVRSRLHPCGRRLVSADSSTLIVRGELDMNIDFPGFGCDMILVVANQLVRTVCWQRRLCSHVCPASWI